MMRNHKYICPVCRKSYKDRRDTCCGYSLIWIGYRARPPKKDQVYRWKQFVKRFLPPVYSDWIEMNAEEKKGLYRLWLGLGLEEEFRKILSETERIYWYCKGKKISATSMLFMMADFLKKM
ncbi:hypothetical protein [Persephonella sp.]